MQHGQLQISQQMKSKKLALSLELNELFAGYQVALIQQLASMSSDEKLFLHHSQQVLKRKRMVSEMLLGGLVGKRFEEALAFYLSHSDPYLYRFGRLTQMT